MDFERWFNERTSRFERILITCAALLLFALLVSQALLTRPEIRSALSLVERLEGAPYEQVNQEEEEAVAPVIPADGPFSVVLAVLNDADATQLNVYVNGEAVAAFGRNGTVEVEVQPGDLVEVDGDPSSYDIEIVVSATSNGIVSPAEGQTVTFFGRPETISWVVVEGN